MPKYEWADFLVACGTANAVTVAYDAERSAGTDFNLPTKERLLKFIAAGELKSHQFIKSDPWRNNPDKQTIVWVDAYSFLAGETFGYLAFMYLAKTRLWRIKSFKKNWDVKPVHTAMAVALQRSGIVPGKRGTEGGNG